MFNRFLFISFISFFSGIILTMNACQSTPQDHRQNTSTSNGDPQDTSAQANLTAGLPQQVQRHLALAAGLLEDKNYAAATAALQPLQRQLGNPASDAASWRDDYARLLARTARGTQNFSAAQTALAMLDQWTAADYLLSADICEALQDYRCSADGYIQATLELGQDHPELPAQINETIWQNLNSAGQGPARFTHRYHHAWWLLQQQIRAADSVPAQQVAWRAWQQRYPGHPASLQPPQILQRLDSYRAPRIALFLPLSGPLESAGTAVRDGLISAFLSEQYNNKPSIRVYDTTAGDIASLWEQALLDGAEVSVGPLLKENVERFSRLTEFASQPRLVLNYLDGAAATASTTPAAAPSTTPAAAPSATPAATPDATTSTTPSASTTATPPATPPATTAATTTEEPAAASVDKLFQFGIAIEDEARSLAKHVLLDGHQRLLIVHSGSRWSRRAYNEYLAQWPYPATSAEFVDIKGLTEVVGEAMQVAASQERKQEIANILGQPLEFVARARQDMDAVVAFVSQLEARALSPALAFHFASNLPIYATSQVARGGHLAELNGFKLTEMPLFAEPNDNQAALDNAFALHSNAQAELFALGFDAYRLATWLQLQRLPLQTPYDQFALPTASGLLRLDNRGKFKRELSLRQVGKDGQLQEPAAN